MYYKKRIETRLIKHYLKNMWRFKPKKAHKQDWDGTYTVPDIIKYYHCTSIDYSVLCE